MRAFLLCAALLALLAAPAQANKFQPKWPGQRPRPFKAVGTREWSGVDGRLSVHSTERARIPLSGSTFPLRAPVPAAAAV